MRPQFLFIASLTVAACALALLLPAAAGAAPPPGYVNPPPPDSSGGWQIGVNSTALPTYPVGTAPSFGEPAGGWTGRIVRVPTTSSAITGEPTRSFVVELSEPFLRDTPSGLRLAIASKTRSLPVVVDTVRRTNVALSSVAAGLTCSNSPWSKPGAGGGQFDLTQDWGLFVGAPNDASGINVTAVHPEGNTHYGATIANGWAADCPYVVQIRVRVVATVPGGYYLKGGSWENGADSVMPRNYITDWNASNYVSGLIYTGAEAGDGYSILCDELAQNDPNRPSDCPAIVLDPTGPLDGLCDGAPVPAWLDFSWLGAFVAHYADCLFVPPFGFDRFGIVSTEFAASPIGEVTVVLQATAESFNFDESCGVILAPVPPLNLSIDTCEWSWAPGFKDPLSIFVLLFGALSVIVFIISLLVSIVTKKSPSPVHDS